MDLLRIDTPELGPVYVDARAQFILGRIDETTTNIGVVLAAVIAKDLVVPGDVDEVAAMIETAYPACRIYRVN